MVTGTVLVLLTWAILLGVLILVGAAFTTSMVFRRAIWWGLAIFVMTVLLVGIWHPLGSASALVWVAALLSPFAAVGGWRLLSTPRVRSPKRDVYLPWLLLGAAGVVAVGYLAWAVLGPVTNYDTGLYHLGAIRYAAEFPTIPGLANLYFPFGYNNALFPLGAFLGNGPWQGEGFRLINGLLYAGLTLDLFLRLRSRSLGTYVLAVGFVVISIPMVAMDDYWMASPTSDPAVFMLTIASIAYLADGITRRSSADLVVALILAAMSVTLRPLMLVFFVSMLIVVIAVQMRVKKDLRIPISGWTSLGSVIAALAIVQSIRDYLLSGWLQFPLSIWSFDVPWLAADPVSNRIPTLGAARDPLDLWAAAEGWNWIGAWVQRLPSQWEFFLLGLLLVAAFLMAFPVRHRINARVLALILTPALALDLVWFVLSPPSFRFAWGPICALGIVPLAIAMKARGRDARLPKVGTVLAAFAILGVTVFTAAFRSDAHTRTAVIAWSVGPVSISVPATPVLLPPVMDRQLSSGLIVQIPIESDQCWDVYPLCTAQLANSVSLRGASISEGFNP